MCVSHGQTISHSSHSSWCWNSGACFTFFWQQGPDTWTGCTASHGVWRYLVETPLGSKTTPFSIFSKLLTNWFVQNADTGCRYSWQNLSFPFILKFSTQKPQKPQKLYVTAWRHHLHINNLIFARSKLKSDQKSVKKLVCNLCMLLASPFILTRHHTGVGLVDHWGR